jgi:hypothetical protein
MALFECNIDARGKAIRLKLGIIGIVVGFVLATVFYFAEIDWWIPWLIPLGIAGGGAFAIFESWAGWCIVRAMGFRTPV